MIPHKEKQLQKVNTNLMEIKENCNSATNNSKGNFILQL